MKGGKEVLELIKAQFHSAGRLFVGFIFYWYGGRTKVYNIQHLEICIESMITETSAF